jgi:hypothetical protein
MLKIRTINNRSDFDGTVRLFSDSGYDQTRALTGSVYKRPAKGELPLEVLQSGPGQTTFSWNGGSFAGPRSPGNWGKNDKITIPATTSGSGNGTFNRNTGLLTVAYSRPGETANSKAVVIQSRNTCKGFYTTGTSVGGFSAAPTK